MNPRRKLSRKLDEKRTAGSLHRPGSVSWPLFTHMSENHGLTLLESEMDDICAVVLKMRVPHNWLDPLLTGPNAVIGNPPYTVVDIENLLNAIRGTPNAEVTNGANKKGQTHDTNQRINPRDP